MFFKSKNIETKPAASLTRISSFLTKDSTFKGDITTNDNLEINGDFLGNIDCKKEIVISEFGTVKGNLKAEKVITKGKIEGKVVCTIFESEKTSFTKEYIEAQTVNINGNFEGIIKCENLTIAENGNVKNLIQSTNIEIAGTLEGDIACEVLTTTMRSNVKGKLFVNKLLNNGGTIDGYIGKFQSIVDEKKSDKPKSKPTTTSKRTTNKTKTAIKKESKEKDLVTS